MEVTRNFFNLVEEGNIDGQEVALQFISWLSSDDVAEFCHSEGYDQMYPELDTDPEDSEEDAEDEDESPQFTCSDGCPHFEKSEAGGGACHLLRMFMPYEKEMCLSIQEQLGLVKEEGEEDDA